jgi:hypothetical protein
MSVASGSSGFVLFSTEQVHGRPYDDIKKVVRVSRSDALRCRLCDRLNGRDFDRVVSHCIEEHDYRLLLVGQEEQGSNSRSLRVIVALLGWERR